MEVKSCPFGPLECGASAPHQSPSMGGPGYQPYRPPPQTVCVSTRVEGLLFLGLADYVAIVSHTSFQSEAILIAPGCLDYEYLQAPKVAE